MSSLFLPRHLRSALFAGACLCPELAVAEQQGDGAGAQVREHKDPPGYVVSISESKYSEAAEELERIVTGPHPPRDAFHVLGQVRLALGQPCAALDAFAKYLTHPGPQLPLATVQRVESHLAQLRSAGASVERCQGPSPGAHLTVRCPLPGASATLDGESVQLSDEASLVPPGRHEVIFMQGGRRFSPIVVDAGPQTTTVVQCAEPPPLPAEAGPSGRVAFNAVQTTGLVLSGAGLATGVASLTMLFYRLGRASAAESLASHPEASQVAESVDSTQWLNGGLAIAAGALTAAGVTLFVVETNKRNKRRSTAAASPGHGVMVQLSSRTAQLAWSGTW